jgi:Ca-activated chloride channel family protein
VNYSRKYTGIGVFVLAGAALLMPHALASSAQRQTPAREQRPPVSIRIETDLVAIDVTATDAGGEYVRDLRAEEFQVFEDGRERPIDFFALTDEATLSRPIAVVFALDLSGSLRPEETTTLRSAALRFTELMKGDAVFAAMTFNHNIKILQGFTDDPRRIESAFGKANKFEGSTRIYDAIDRAVNMLAKQAPRQRRGRPVRRVVVVITDGFDSASTIDRKEMVRRAIAAEVTVYSVTLPSYMLSATQSIDRVITPLDATRVVAATGGRDFAADARDFTPIFRALAEEIRASYVLAYYPDRRDGKYHDVRVQTTRPGVRLRTNRTGYVAPTP